ncbi:beta-glucosidase [Exophiala xenobiotica]|uniref:beta-glucosidase n=1 Tax=Vermiconidia calcicola TaxID=1690605 RepID=A0AAV9QID3_9PEZI|nr:beta-glucosidase [Exophiala xenobiotica]KAK5543826.1 beta-glucosidase [Vermiconidia calcicola]KAK5548504.1 beta-glucosidase [Chaetothyriales sp. CCFEE 6169]KAK5197295.1 beta-glucosidase [Exophiala xenobiotica]KAK5213665.1 beta-glucosidase [Exophiala xenobiotica]
MGSVAPQTSFDVEEVLPQLTISEKVDLLSGIDFWHTAPVHRLGVPSIRLSDGPNGVRGTRFFNGVPAACLPCGTGLAATWDTDLVKKGGRLQGHEAIAKGATVILGPTTNMQRSPLGGRGFESFSEDPFLAGAMSAATVNGIQSTGVAATIKHYVCNDQEDQRQAVDSILTERALREIYLMPFMIAQRDSRPECYMTAYNRVNGVHASENPRLLQDVLRGEWGFDGLVMSDWFGTYSTTESIKAGLDLEMPGPSYIRGKLVNQALGCGKLSEHDIDQRVREVLKLVQKTLSLGIPENAPETTVDTPETAALLRKIASNGIVLMKNEDKVLPFEKSKTTAIIGPNAAYAAYCGGGSASLLPYYAISPLDGLRAQAPDAKYALGAPGWKSLPLMTRLAKTKDDKPGLTMKVFLDPPSERDRKPIDEVYVNNSDILLVDYKHPLVKTSLYWVELDGTFTPSETSEYEFSLAVAGTGKIFVNGECVVDNETKQRPGNSFFGAGTAEEIGTLKLNQGETYNIHITFGTFPTMRFSTHGTTGFGAGGLRIGLERKVEIESEIERAVRIAKQADQVVLCAGLNKDWESEGYDREHMDLPPGSDDLIKAVLAANPNTAIVIQSGTPVAMPWLKEARAILQAWYGGNETGNAIADVVFGKTNPSGKLPLSFPVRNEDNPAFLNYKSERNRAIYGEDVYVGYRFYEKTKKEVAFPFAHGLSYTTFHIKDLSIEDDEVNIAISASVTNTGNVDGAQVVQAYVSQQNPSVNRPPKELKGFAKVFVKAGATEKVRIFMSKKYAASFWDEARDSWTMEKGTYDVLVGDSSASTPLQGQFKVRETRWWKGL